MKDKNILLRLSFIIIILLGGHLNSSAFSSSLYASHSKLASGKWIKVKVAQTGVTEISNDELKSFGFTDPSKVRVFGYGGQMISEILVSSGIDDLIQVPISRTNDKMYFYAKAGRTITANYTNSVNPRFSPSINPYSEEGYYFLTDENYPELLINIQQNNNSGTQEENIGFDYAYHELELKNIGSTGKVFLGEDFTNSMSLTLNMSMPGLVPGTTISNTTSVAYYGTSTAYITTSVNGDAVVYDTNSNIIRSSTTVYDYYKIGAPSGLLTPKSHNENAQVTVGLGGPSTAKLAALDYLIFTYQRYASLLDNLNQCRINFQTVGPTNKLTITDSNNSTCVWNISDTQSPVQYNLDFSNDNDGNYKGSFTPSTSSTWLPLIAFNTSREQNKVTLVGEVPNQDLHGMNVPDMLIITAPAFRQYAQQIADLHATNDNMDVAIVEQEKIFNEFSSGTPDATAYRKLAKMFWDRDQNKFKYLLLFGSGSFDNRDLSNNRNKNRLLTYQSDRGTNETESYTTDDYFGFLNDNSGGAPISDKLCIGIGRMPVTDIDDAQTTVNKLLDYVNNAPYKIWRNNAMVISDEGESSLFSYQTEGLEKLLNDTLSVNLHFNKIYTANFIKNNDSIAQNAKNKMKQLLADGQLLVSYVGHGGPSFLTKTAKLWSRDDVLNTEYPNLPLFTLATCDVARFDSESQGIAELMFHQKNGGAIALMASSRTVYATENDILNRAFLRTLFTPTPEGVYPTLGNAIMSGKLSFARGSLNKLNFLLFGDPAMKLIYPRNGVVITSINGETPEDASIYPLSKVTIKGRIENPDNTLNSNFNGTITLDIYGAKLKFADLTINSTSPTRTSYINNNKLCQYATTVVNGEFSIECIMPNFSISQNELGSISAYAFSPNTNQSFSANTLDIALLPFDESVAITDNVPPSINSMYLNNTSFKNGDEVDNTPRLFINISDDNGLNMQSSAIGNSSTLLLDGNKSYANLNSNFSISDNAKEATLALDLTNLDPGKHTLEFFVSDVANNRVSKIISFYYSADDTPYDLIVEEYPAQEKATFTLSDSESKTFTEAKISVVDSKGNMIWNGSTSAFPFEWNLLDQNNARVAPGAYSFYGTFKSETGVGSSNYKKIIVVKQ